MKTSSMRTAFGEALCRLGEEHNNLVVLDADLSKATMSYDFSRCFPERFFNMGIAEQNLVGCSVGLSSCGKIPVATTIAAFLSMRACEQIRTSVCIGNFNVKLAGVYGGLCTAENGATHQCIVDLAIMRSLPHMTVLAPSDAASCRACMRWAVGHQGPVYIRILRDDEPVLYADESEVDVVEGNILHSGNDIGIISNGFCTHMALQAAEELEKNGIGCEVLDLFSIKPVPKERILAMARKCRAVVTVEEHNVCGGVGSAVCEVLAQDSSVPVKMIGINDCFSDSAGHTALLKQAGLTAENIVKTVTELADKTG